MNTGRAERRLNILPELSQGFDNLRAHKLRSILTMLGMIFGVAAVIAMLSIGAGAQQQVIAFIEQLGVRNIIVEARESTDYQVFQKVRLLSGGLSFRDLRAIEASLEGINAISARKRFVPSKVLPKPQGDVPAVFGVAAVYQEGIGGLKLTRGRFFTAAEDDMAPCRFGQSAATGSSATIDRPLCKAQRGVVPRRRRRAAVAVQATWRTGARQQQRVYVPINAAILRMGRAGALRDRIGAITSTWPRRTRYRGHSVRVLRHAS
jgi:putative ABC transport system permease protein